MNIVIHKMYLCLLLIGVSVFFTAHAYKLTKLVDTNAHEGPVFVASQNRLYFTTKPNLVSQTPNTAIHYLDLSTLKVFPFIEAANMANGMYLAKEGNALLIAEQGTKSTLGVISKIDLNTKKRKVLVERYQNKPFNSPNKVIQSTLGWIYFSDPHYGYNQGFKEKPLLPQSIYAFHPIKKEVYLISRHLSLPHGLGLSENNQRLYISDTAAIDGHSPYDPTKTKDILVANFITPTQISRPKFILKVPVGIPDGFIVTKNNELWVAAGDGIRHYSNTGKLLDEISIPQGAINLTFGNHTLYITADSAIYQIKLK